MDLILLAIGLPVAGGLIPMVWMTCRDRMRELNRDIEWHAAWHERIYEDY